MEIGTAKFDLRFDLYETYRGLDGYLEYASDLFDRATIERMGQHYLTLLEAIAANPDRRIGDLPLLTPAEREQMLVTWNRTAAPSPQDTCVHDAVAAAAARAPQAAAVISAEGTLGFGELDRRAAHLAAYFAPAASAPTWSSRSASSARSTPSSLSSAWSRPAAPTCHSTRPIRGSGSPS